MKVSINGRPAIVGRCLHRVKGIARTSVLVNGKMVPAVIKAPRTNPETGEYEHSRTVFEWGSRRYWFNGDARNMGRVVTIEGFDPVVIG